MLSPFKFGLGDKVEVIDLPEGKTLETTKGVVVALELHAKGTSAVVSYTGKNGKKTFRESESNLQKQGTRSNPIVFGINTSA